AIKVLPGHLSENPELKQRLEREARAISSLSHPNICALHDIGHQDGLDYLVMEYLEGGTLTEKLAKGPLPPDQVLRYGIQIADALDKAHRQGIVHRDLKPGNIIVTKSGVKLLDFGLAKLRPPGAQRASSGLSLLATEVGELTTEGTILGTFQYMAPEQLEGRDTDTRSDIFAFGAVLYEMATGRKAFSGRSQASLIAAILDAQPPAISSVQPLTPPALDRVVQTCLAKDPDDRWQTAHDVMLELKWIAEGGSQAGVPAPVAARRKVREGLAWGLAAFFAIMAALLAYLLWARPKPASGVVDSAILPPEETRFRFLGQGGGPPALSPDAAAIAFGARDASGKNAIWVRSLGSPSARRLPGTEGGMYPFWSPDGNFVGFFADGRLKKIAPAGGPSLVLSEAVDPRGGTWNRDGVIVFEPHFRAPLHKVSSSGGDSIPVTKLDPARRETTHRWPHFLPDGRRFLFFSGSHAAAVENDLDAIFVGSLDPAEKPRLLVRARSNGGYAAGHLLYVRQKTLLAQPFDAEAAELSGEPVPVAENVQVDPGWFVAIFSAAQNVLAFQPGGGTAGLSQLVWLDRTGKVVEKIGSVADHWEPRLSPDGSRFAFGIDDPGDIWIREVRRGTATRFTFDPADEFATAWSRDGSRIVFSSGRSGAGDLYIKSSSGTASEKLLFSSTSFKIPMSWSPDGRHIAFGTNLEKTKADVWLISPDGGKPVPLLNTPFDEYHLDFSPDGRFFAYVSNETGRNEVYVQEYPGPGGRWQISTAEGTFPAWRNDGRELFYYLPEGKLAAVEIRTSPTFQAGAPRVLFDLRLKESQGRGYDVSADGQRFLCNVQLPDETVPPITLVQNWTARLGR
ncbi:MAG TPA: protein kinase, partial [Thermoanaerobaculia bacterium]|nr:protein kinase [Thermoanaerobaculia bacterium]